MAWAGRDRVGWGGLGADGLGEGIGRVGEIWNVVEGRGAIPARLSGGARRGVASGPGERWAADGYD
ncbi:hypothetical protein J1614_007265 [Plenodomus biglobosus]|nr:hypothetical protein J1614_007265 [Plenodomus biglobosus]